MSLDISSVIRAVLWIILSDFLNRLRLRNVTVHDLMGLMNNVKHHRNPRLSVCELTLSDRVSALFFLSVYFSERRLINS
jgi:hypothetical protein